MKRFIIAVLLFFTMTVSPFSAFAEEMGDSHIAYEELLTAWSSEGLDIYPDFIGGVYFGDDGLLVVALSDNTEANRSTVLSMTSAPEGIRFEDARYSYNELNDILIDINDKIDTDGYDFEVQNAVIDEESNRIDITTDEDSFSAASDHFASAYSSKVYVHSESEIDTFDTEEYTEDTSDDFFDDSYTDDSDYQDGTDGNEAYNENAFFAFSTLSSVWAEAGYSMYPPYVGGVYFAENGNLVVALCNDNESNRNAVLSASGHPDVIEFKTVSYSYDELYSIQEEIGENYNNNFYDFLVNFYSISEEDNVVEIRVASSELDLASQYFKSLYGDKVVVLGGYDTEEDTGYEDDRNTGSTLSEKVKSTSGIRLYISIGIIVLAVAAVLVLTYLPAFRGSSAKRRYRK